MKLTIDQICQCVRFLNTKTVVIDHKKMMKFRNVGKVTIREVEMNYKAIGYNVLYENV